MVSRGVKSSSSVSASYGKKQGLFSARSGCVLTEDVDVIIGDATLYTRQDMVEASWAVVDAVQHVWDETKFDFPNYAAGSWGPQAADDILARRGHVWRQP